MDRKKAIQILDEIRKAAEAVAAKHGCTLKPASGKFDTTMVRFSGEIQEISASGKPASFERNAFLVGLPADCYGKTFSFGGKIYEITDIVPRKSKFPVIAKSGSKSFKFPADAVRNLISAVK